MWFKLCLNPKRVRLQLKIGAFHPGHPMCRTKTCDLHPLAWRQVSLTFCYGIVSSKNFISSTYQACKCIHLDEVFIVVFHSFVTKTPVNQLSSLSSLWTIDILNALLPDKRLKQFEQILCRKVDSKVFQQLSHWQLPDTYLKNSDWWLQIIIKTSFISPIWSYVQYFRYLHYLINEEGPHTEFWMLL